MYTQIRFKSVLFDVEVIIEEAESMVRNYGDGSGYPGSAARVKEVYEFSFDGACFIEFYDDYKDEINELILEKLND